MPSSMMYNHSRTETRIWVGACLIALLLHLGVILGIRLTKPFDPSPLPIRDPEPIELIFAVDAENPPLTSKEDPTFFSELLPEQANQSPEHPDFLSNVDSRSRDLLPGGEAGAMPNLVGDSDAPHVRMIPGAAPSYVSAEPACEPSRGDRDSQPDPEPGSDLPEDIPETIAEIPSNQPIPDHEISDRSYMPSNQSSRAYSPESRRPKNARLTPSPKRNLAFPSLGTADLFQEQMYLPSGNAELSGIVSMNTVEWAYAPWLQRLKRDMVKSWLAPVAYYMGIISGWTVVELEIASDGSLRRLSVIERNGHESLHQTSVVLFKALAPFHALPRDFPRESLILSIKLTYPPVRRS